MGYILLKLLVTSVMVVLASELARRIPLVGALLAAIPLVSLLALTWLYIETKNTEEVAAFATSIFWLVLPSLAFFPLLAILLRQRCNYYLALALALGTMIALYALTIWTLQRLGIRP